MQTTFPFQTMTEVEREEEFRKSCNKSENYPQCLINPVTHEYNLKSYHERLDDQSSRLFCSDSKADVDMWEYVDFSSDFQITRIKSSFEIRGHFEGERLFDEADPICRYLFISAPNSRDILRISRKILNYILTYYQVMPAFLDFIFQFGLQEYAQDFHFSGFREETHLSSAEKGLQVKKLGRSGRDICMCYSLKSVERLDGDNWPWSIRQTAAYHSFDVETGRAFWILVKANEVIEERVQDATNPDRLARFGGLEEAWKSFASALETHLILCDWSLENWRWYVNFLEGVLQDISSRSLGVRIGTTKLAKPEEVFRATTRRTFSTVAVSENGFSHQFSSSSQTPLNRQVQALPGDPPPPPPVLPPGMHQQSTGKNNTSEEHQEFTFHDLQQVQSIEEKTNEVLLVLDSNVHILTELKEYYQSVVSSHEWPKELANATQNFTRFSKRITNIITELQMHRSRTENLLRLLSDRKNLLYGILQFHNMEANKKFTRKAQESADRMEKITVDMHDIAKKTKQETVSMKIITVVTLFFLPGTFMSTIMSTDIVRWQNDSIGETKRVYQSGALILYLAITIPLMILTFGSWRAVYLWMRHMEKKDVEKSATESKA